MFSNGITVIYVFFVKEELYETFLDKATLGISMIRQEKGCLQAFLYKEPQFHQKFIMIESWKDEKHWKNFLQSSTSFWLSEHVAPLTSNWKIRKLNLCAI